MNRRFLTGLLILVCLSLIVNECYAWPEPPDIYISDWILYTEVGNSVDVVADVYSGGPIYYWDWDWPGALNGTYDEYSYSSTATVWSNTPGQYQVDVEGEDEYGQYDSDYAWVYVIDVDIDTPSSFPAYVELGNDLALGCTSYGATGGTYSWTKVSGPGNVTFTPSASAEDPDFSADQSGNYTVKVEYTKEEATASDTSGTIKVVKVVNVISSKDVACIGENVTFGAITDPLNCGHLVTVTWSGGGNPPTGSGSQFTTNWSTPGTKTVTATCGTSSAQKNVTVVKVDKIVKSGTTDEGPLYVVCADDTVSLEAKPYPAGASFATGEPHWTIESQPGTSASLSPSSGSATTTLSGLTEPGDYSVKAKCGDFDTGDTIVVTTPPSSGYWEDFMPGFTCPTNGGPNQVAKPDDCGNRLAVYCDSNNSGGFEAFSWWYRAAGQTGRGTEVGLCVWTGGVNIFDYKVTDETNYGKERYLQTRHVTHNDDQGIDGDGEGCDGYWCWRVEKYDCVNETSVGGSPWWRRHSVSPGGSEYEGEPCLGTGGEHPCYPN